MQFTFWEESPPDEAIAQDTGHGSLSSRIGKAGEYIVAAELELAGLSCSIAAEGLPFDLVAVDADDRVHRVQVKTTSKPNRNAGYWFAGGHPRKDRGPKRAMCEYSGADVMALVALDKRAALYMRTSDVVTKTVYIRESRYCNDALRSLSLQTAFSLDGDKLSVAEG